MNGHDEERVKNLIKRAIPQMSEREPARDLWPDALRRLDAAEEAPPWFDWVLAGAAAAFVAFVPITLPVLLYYL